MQNDVVFLEDFEENDAIKLEPYEWHHLCVIYSDVKLFIYFNENVFEIISEESHRPLKLNENVTVSIGGDNIVNMAFSGIIADVRLYPKVINAREFDKISKFVDIDSDYSTIPEYLNENIQAFVPNNSYMINGPTKLLYFMMDISYLLMKKTDTFITVFNQKYSCSATIDICEKFGGYIPHYEDINSLSSLSILVKNYISATNIKFNNFWIIHNSTIRKVCRKAVFNEIESTINILSFRDDRYQQIPALCVLLKKTIYYLKASDKNYNMIAIPNSNHVFENIKESTRLYWSSVYSKAIFINLKYNVTIEEVSVPEGPSFIMGRSQWILTDISQSKEWLIFSVCVDGEFTCSPGNCINMSLVCDYQKDCSDGSDEEFCDVGVRPPRFYEKRLAPVANKTDKVAVALNVTLNRVDVINMNENLIVLNLKIRASWSDRRLKFKNLVDNQSMYVHSKIVEKVWNPRITIIQSVSNDKTVFHLDTSPGNLLALKTDSGTLTVYDGYEVFLYEGQDVRLTHEKTESVKINCRMELYLYPFDTQICNLSFVIEGIIHSDVKWDKFPVIKIKDGEGDLALYSDLKFYFHDYQPQEEAQLNAILSYNRKNGAYVFNTFLPCLILELIGILTLLMPSHDYQDRVSVTLSCLIVMSALFTQVSTSLPTSADPKLIDVWMFTHVALLFVVFLVHIIVIYIHSQSNSSSEGRPTYSRPDVKYSSDIIKMKNKIKVMSPVDSVSINKELQNLSWKTHWPLYIKVDLIGLTFCTCFYIIFLCFFFYSITRTRKN